VHTYAMCVLARKLHMYVRVSEMQGVVVEGNLQAHTLDVQFFCQQLSE
jgi:hypothetical protein